MTKAAGKFKVGTNPGTDTCGLCGERRQVANMARSGGADAICNRCYDRAGDENAVSDGDMTCEVFAGRYPGFTPWSCECDGTFHTTKESDVTTPEAPVKATKATKPAKAAATPKVKPIPDISRFSTTKQLALLRCWLGAAKGSAAAHAKYDGPIAEAQARLRVEMDQEAALKAANVAATAQAKAEAAERVAKGKAEAKAAKAAERNTNASPKAKAAKAATATPSANGEASEAPELTEVTPAAPTGRRTGRKLDTKDAVKAELRAILS